MSISLCFHVYNHIVLPSPTSLLFSKHYFCFCLPVSILLSLSCSLSLSPFLVPLLAVWTLSAALTSLFFLIRLLSYTLYFAIHPIPSHTHTSLHPSHHVFHFQPAKRGRGVLIHLRSQTLTRLDVKLKTYSPKEVGRMHLKCPRHSLENEHHPSKASRISTKLGEERV